MDEVKKAMKIDYFNDRSLLEGQEEKYSQR